MLETRIISFRDVAERMDLLEAHYEELATDKELMALDPDLAKYATIEANGMGLGIGLYDHGELVGYSYGCVTQSMHYKALTIYQNDVVFLAKAYRDLGNGTRLINNTVEHAQLRGARLILWHAKPDTPLEALLALMGYDVQDVIYSKGL